MQQQVNPDDKKKFHTALLALHSDIQAFKKDESNPFYRSMYVPLPKMLEILKPLARKHGFVLSQPVDVTNSQAGIENVVFSTLVHVETGLSEVSKLALPKIDDMQKLGGAVTYARRYTLSSLLALEETDDDGNTAAGKQVKKTTVKAKDKF